MKLALGVARGDALHFHGAPFVLGAQATDQRLVPSPTGIATEDPVASRPRRAVDCANARLTRRPGFKGSMSSLARWRSATAWTRLRPRPLPGVVRLCSPR